MTLAEKLTALRKQKGLTQIELAEKLCVSRQAVSRWEVGSAVPGTDKLKALSALYALSVDELLSEDAVGVGRQTEAPQEPTAPTRERKGVFLSYWTICAGVMLLLTILAALLLGRQSLNQGSEQSRPIEEWTRMETPDDIPYTFSIDP